MSRRSLFAVFSTKKNRFRTLTLENLEDRQVLSANTLAASTGAAQAQVGVFDPGTAPPIVYDAANHRITINGDGGNNMATVKVDTHGTGNIVDDEIVATITTGTQTTELRVMRVTNPTTLTPAVTDIVFRGYAGNDSFTNLTAIGSTAYGGDGDDTLVGGTGYNYLYGENGADTLRGGVAGNALDGGAGNDFIYGGKLADYIFGRDGDDTIDAGDGNNVVDGGVGNDSIKTGSGIDSITGGDGDDGISSGDGDDLVYGGNGNDSIVGGAGRDVLYGDAGNDIIDGGLGADDIHGGDGNDTLYGQKGNFWGRTAKDGYSGEGDTVHGDPGDDILYVGELDFADGGLGQNFINVAVRSRK